MTADAYKLPPDQHEAIYSEIAARYMGRSKPQEKPVAVITGGQPGSGKSRLADAATARFKGSGGYLLVDADKLRPLHPSYSPLLRENDRQAADLTHPDCGAWAARLLRDGVAGRRNLVIDQTSRDPAALARISRDLRAAGYTVELHAMAVNPLVSEQRIHSRYETQKAVDGFGRFSNKDKHDQAFEGLAATVAAAEAQGLVDRLCLYTKDHALLYDNRLEAGAWSIRPPTAAVEFTKERTRTLTAKEAGELASEYGKLAKLVNQPAHQATDQEKATIKALQRQAEGLGLAASGRGRSLGRSR